MRRRSGRLLICALLCCSGGAAGTTPPSSPRHQSRTLPTGFVTVRLSLLPQAEESAGRFEQRVCALSARSGSGRTIAIDSRLLLKPPSSVGGTVPRRGSAVATHSSSVRAREEDEEAEVCVTSLDRVRVLSYRSALLIASLGYVGIALSAFFGGNSGSGIGLSEDSVADFGEASSSVAAWAAGSSALLAPSGNDRGEGEKGGRTSSSVVISAIDVALPIVGAAALALQIAAAIATDGAPPLAEELRQGLISVALAFVCVREMAYFGVGYKAEAAIALILLSIGPLISSAGPPAPSLTAGLALSFSVLSVAKVFEPVLEDLRPGESRFFVLEESAGSESVLKGQDQEPLP